jgi:DNA polymerase-3 subunit gamma/tau
VQPARAATPVEESVVVTTAGTIDLAGLRGLWPRVLEAVKSRSRTAHALLVPHADLGSVDGSQLSLFYANPSISRQFFAHGGAHAEVLAEALAAELGGTWRIALATGPGGANPGGTSPAAAPTSAPDVDGGAAPDPWDEPAPTPPPTEPSSRPAPEHLGFAPGDEPTADDDRDDDTGDGGGSALRGEDLAFDLLRAQMGAVVVGELDNT